MSWMCLFSLRTIADLEIQIQLNASGPNALNLAFTAGIDDPLHDRLQLHCFRHMD